MSEPALDGLLSDAVQSMLETMFFTESLPGEGSEDLPALAAALSFRGSPSGDLAVSISAASLRQLAAGFLGEDESDISEEQAGAVVCEMANILCGSVVSRLESDRTFDLASPQLVSAPFELPAGGLATRQRFVLDQGSLTVALRLEERPA